MMGLRYLLVLSIIAYVPAFVKNDSADHWQIHVIDNSSQGADGVRLGDLDHDGRVDIVTGWEQGGIVRVYLNPGAKKTKQLWPAVTVGKAPSVEDAVFVDLDGDGWLDVVSSCEGKKNSHFVHWAPTEPSKLLDPDEWKTELIPATHKVSRWMFCVPCQIDGSNGTDLVVGSKDPDGQVGWIESPSNARQIQDWKYHPLTDAGWIMSLRKFDIDGDKMDDVLVSDRKGKQRGIFWLKRNATSISTQKRWIVGDDKYEVMFLDCIQDKHSADRSVVSATRNGTILWLALGDNHQWRSETIPNPNQIKQGKAIAIGDINLDGQMDLVHTTNRLQRTDLPGVSLLTKTAESKWQNKAISSSDGIKFDRIELVDLDGDGDLDVLTCEEKENLGVIWYENPTR